jgi:hypothetical protein
MLRDRAIKDIIKVKEGYRSGVLIQQDCCPCGKGKRHQDRSSEKAAMYKPGKQASPVVNSASTLILSSFRNLTKCSFVIKAIQFVMFCYSALSRLIPIQTILKHG